MLDSYLHKIGAESAPNNPDVRYSQGKLESLGDHLSITERNSVDAERESVKTKLLEYYERELKKDEKQTFKAIITDVKNHGLFVELTDSQAFGMIHISTLDDDFYHPSSDGNSLVGRRHQKTYSLGQHIMVQVERVDRFKRQIDFRVTATTDRIDKRTKINEKDGKGSSRGRGGNSRPSNKSSRTRKDFSKPKRGGKPGGVKKSTRNRRRR